MAREWERTDVSREEPCWECKTKEAMGEGGDALVEHGESWRGKGCVNTWVIGEATGWSCGESRGECTPREEEAMQL